MNRTKESEETEVKKGIEWLRKEFDDLFNGRSILTVGKSVVDEIIDQLDEPETIEQTTLLFENVLKENKRLGKLLEEKHEEWLELMDEINNQEVLSQEWIDNHTDKFVSSLDLRFVSTKDLQNLLVPKQELPAIPQFVANVIEAYKSNSRLTNLLADLMFHGGLADFVKYEDEDEMFEWARSNYRKATDEILARAWLHGYELVEEEPLYRARLKVITDEFISSYLRTQSSGTEDRLKALEIGSKYIHEDYRHLSEFTQDELKRLDIWDSNQWELEEVEE